jgi:cytochrome c-type biogenesis protein
MEYYLVIPAFIAGLLTFLAPCTLPLIPGYLAFISGVPGDQLGQTQTSSLLRRKIVLNGLSFIVGFSLVFIVFGTLAGLVGIAFAPYRLWLSRIGGILIILFGLFTLNILKIPFLSVEKHLKLQLPIERGKPFSSLILGSAFGFGWTPCVGPILGSILVLVSTTTTIWQGTFLLFIFSLGLAVPFLVIAYTIGSADRFIRKYAKTFQWLSYGSGFLLIFLGIILLTNNMARLIATGYRLLEFINYNQLLNYL